MAARSKRKKGSRRSGASRGGSGGPSALSWFTAGAVLGVSISAFLFYKGYLPLPLDTPVSADRQSVSSEPELIGNNSIVTSEQARPRYDFFTVLPEMEVVVPERELSSRAQPDTTVPTGDAGDQFILQAGSFRSAADADELKARLALLGSVATIQTVTVNNETWHRVRIGPIEGARRADELRRMLQDNGIDVLVLRGSS